MGLDAIWLYLCQDAETYAERKRLFIWMLKKLLQEETILLAKNGKPIDWTIEEVTLRFEISFPSDDENLNNGVWFFTDECPASIGWRMSNGYIDWV